MQTAKITSDGKGWKVTIPAAVDFGGVKADAGVEKFPADKALDAMNRCNAINEAYEGKDKADKAATGPRVEILSLDGKPVDGIPTVQATDEVVYTTKPTEKNKLKEPKHTTERDMTAVTGYVLVSRDRNGKIRQGWTNADAADFGRPIPLTLAGLAAVRALLSTTAQ